MSFASSLNKHRITKDAIGALVILTGIVALVRAPMVLSEWTPNDNNIVSRATAETSENPPAVSPRAIVTVGPFTSYQVNVDVDGNNVIGDAANEPSIAVDPTAALRMAIGWRQFDTITDSFREAGYSYSRDGGRTWAETNVLDDGEFRSDPVLAAGPTGTFYYLTLRHTSADESVCDVHVSHDAGATWPEVHFSLGGDKPWLCVDPLNNHLYQSWNIDQNIFAPAQFNRSLDAGLTWQLPVVYDPAGDPPAQPVFGTIDTGPNSEVYVAGTRNVVTAGTHWIARSTNAANPGQPVRFDLIRTLDLGGVLGVGNAPNPGGLLGQINVKVDSSGGAYNGRVYVMSSVVPTEGGDPMDIHIISSSDGGFSWTAPVRINDDPPGTNAWQWFAAMDIAPDGRIDVIWNDTRNTGQANMSELFYCFSTDGGATWSPNLVVSPVFDSYLGWPMQQKLGDYYFIVSDTQGAHVAYAATFNGEQDVYYLRIGDEDCNNNGIGDDVDLYLGNASDCNNNDILDECEIAIGLVEDINQNGVPDACQPCIADMTDSGKTNQPDGVVDVADLFVLLSDWSAGGPAGELAAPPTVVDVFDLFVLLGSWGDCPTIVPPEVE